MTRVFKNLKFTTSYFIIIFDTHIITYEGNMLFYHVTPPTFLKSALQ